MEKSKATEAFNYWAAVQSAEERYIAQNGVYAAVTDQRGGSSTGNPLDIVLPTLQYFNFDQHHSRQLHPGRPRGLGP